MKEKTVLWTEQFSKGTSISVQFSQHTDAAWGDHNRQQSQSYNF